MITSSSSTRRTAPSVHRVNQKVVNLPHVLTAVVTQPSCAGWTSVMPAAHGERPPPFTMEILAMTLSITSNRHSGVVLMWVRGDLSYATATQFRTAISTAIFSSPRPSRLVVDLGDVATTDQTGIGSLVVANRICRHVGVQLDVRHPGAILKPMFGLNPNDKSDDTPWRRGDPEARSARHTTVTQPPTNRHRRARSST
jgi:anti-anti-sigma factor